MQDREPDGPVCLRRRYEADRGDFATAAAQRPLRLGLVTRDPATVPGAGEKLPYGRSGGSSGLSPRESVEDGPTTMPMTEDPSGRQQSLITYATPVRVAA